VCSQHSSSQSTASFPSTSIKPSKMTPRRTKAKPPRVKGISIYRPFGPSPLPSLHLLPSTPLITSQSSAPSPNPSTPPTVPKASTPNTRTNGPFTSKASTTTTSPTGSKKSNLSCTKPTQPRCAPSRPRLLKSPRPGGASLKSRSNCISCLRRTRSRRRCGTR